MPTRTSPSTYRSLDFQEWRDRGVLSLTPKFQRRGVWTLPARSYLIDTLIREMPVPPIYLRELQSPDRKKVIREVVDGQQRIRTVLDYLDDSFALSKALDAPYAGKRFGQLTDEQQDSIRTFEFNCLMLGGISDSSVLEVFARLNTYSVKLNAQELRNGRFFGLFKQLAYALAHEHVEFWRRNAIFSERGIARMVEVEFTSELLIAELAGLQDKKKSIDTFYKQYDAEFEQRRDVERKFRLCLETISTSTPEDVLKESEFCRPPLFYSLFSAVYHRIFGLPQFSLKTPKRRLSRSEEESLRNAVATLSEPIAAARENEPFPKEYEAFVTACLRQTDNIQPRKQRLETIYSEAFD